MALSSSIVWEIRSTGTAGMVNGGGFKTGASGTDFSQQNAAQYALTGVTTAAADAILLTASAAADMVGNVARIVSGTNFTVGWYEIISVVVGVSITLDRTCTSAAGALGVINIGGAISFNSTFEDSFGEALIGGNIVYVKSGTVTMGSAMSVASVSATGTAPIRWIGYNSTRGDNPSISSGTQPIIAAGSNTVTFGANWHVSYISFTTTAPTGIGIGSQGYFNSCKFLNTSSTASRNAVSTGASTLMYKCDAVSQNGPAIGGATTARILYSHIHDSQYGFGTGFGASSIIMGCVLNSNRVAAISSTVVTGLLTVVGNTIRGSSGKIGVGIESTGVTFPHLKIYNNIISGCVTGIAISTVSQYSNGGETNNFYDNTTDVTNYVKSGTDIALDPGFVDVSEITGTTATTSGSVLTQAGGDFSSVEDNVDFLRVVSGTGVTTGIYLITSHTSNTVTVNNALGTSSGGDVVYVIPTGHNLSVGDNMKAAGSPGLIGVSASTSYLDIGAVQRVEPAASGGGGTANVGRGYMRGVI